MESQRCLKNGEPVSSFLFKIRLRDDIEIRKKLSKTVQEQKDLKAFIEGYNQASGWVISSLSMCQISYLVLVFNSHILVF